MQGCTKVEILLKEGDKTSSRSGETGKWTTDGCFTYIRQTDQFSTQLECQCFHLTYFAIIVSENFIECTL